MTANKINTNYQMLRELLNTKNYTPKHFGVSTSEEVELICDTLHVLEMSILALRNLRDFIVLYMSQDVDGMEAHDRMITMDKMSAIVGVIDCRIVELGGEV